MKERQLRRTLVGFILTEVMVLDIVVVVVIMVVLIMVPGGGDGRVGDDGGCKVGKSFRGRGGKSNYHLHNRESFM